MEINNIGLSFFIVFSAHFILSNSYHSISRLINQIVHILFCSTKLSMVFILISFHFFHQIIELVL